MDTCDGWLFWILAILGAYSTHQGLQLYLGGPWVWFQWDYIRPAKGPRLFARLLWRPCFLLGAMPIGLALLIYSLTPILTSYFVLNGNVLLLLMLSLIGLGIWLVVQRPRWALPRWYRWLEDNYKGVLPLLQREVKQDKMWHKRTATQKDLERWAAEVWHKRWLQSRYDADTVAFMLAEARMDDHWLGRVATPEGLAQWAREMAARYHRDRKGKCET